MRKLTQALIIIVLLITPVAGVVVMARGHEDWFIVKTAFGKALQDVGEQAARFGVPYSFTRSGKVIYSDGFEASLAPWRVGKVGTDTVVERSDTYSYRGAYSLHILTDDGVADYGRIEKLITYLQDTRTGIEFLGWFIGASAYIIVGADVRTTTAGMRCRIKINYDGVLSYYGADENYHEFASLGGGFNVAHPAFFLFKLVIDMEKDTYAYFRVNETIYDLSSYLPFIITSTIPGRIDWRIQGFSDPGGDTGEFYIDDVTVTIDEP